MQVEDVGAVGLGEPHRGGRGAGAGSGRAEPGGAAEMPGPASPQYEIITVAYKSRKPLERLLSRLPASTPLIVVDNSRQEEDLADLLAAHPNARYVDSGGNVGFGAACNLGAQWATRRFLIFLNPDTLPDPGSFALLIAEIEKDPACASCGPALVDETGSVQRGAGGWQPTLGRALVHATGIDRLLPSSGIWFGHGSGSALPVEWLAGTCLAVRREVFLEVGGFDPRYFLYQEDMDLGRRLHGRGYRQVLRADLRLRHAGGGSSPSSYTRGLWTLRGRMLAEYLNTHHSPLRAGLLRVVLGSGYLVRAALYRAQAEHSRAAEMWTYTRTLLRTSAPR